MKDKFINFLFMLFFGVAVVFIILNVINRVAPDKLSEKDVEKEFVQLIKDSKIKGDITYNELTSEKIKEGTFYEQNLVDENGIEFQAFLIDSKLGDLKSKYVFSNYTQKFIEKELTNQLDDFLLDKHIFLLGQYDSYTLDNIYSHKDDKYNLIEQNLLTDIATIKEIEFIVKSDEKDFYLNDETLEHYYSVYQKLQKTYVNTKILFSFTTIGNVNDDERIQAYNEDYFNATDSKMINFDEFRESVIKNKENKKTFIKKEK